MKRANILGRRVRQVLPQIESYWIETFGKVAITGEPAHIENYSKELGRWYNVFAYSPSYGQFAVVFSDITQRKQTEDELRKAKDGLEIRVRERTVELQKAVEELKRSNHDLEQFAYVSSHDLQEPLRMVASYVGLLENRYSDRFDDEARVFMGFIIEGAKRMQTLIHDLLAYSRINTRAQQPKPVDTEQLLQTVLQDLSVTIQEAGATVTHDLLPTVLADRTQLGQVFLNLIGNGLKFKKSGVVPTVHVGVEKQNSEWLFSVRDNGIGIAPEYQESIFVIFKRLHVRRLYPGNGIGLTVVKRIVERHGGRVWIESQPNEGATFYFTIPAA